MFVVFFLILCSGRGTNPSHAYIIIYIAAAVFAVLAGFGYIVPQNLSANVWLLCITRKFLTSFF